MADIVGSSAADCDPGGEDRLLADDCCTCSGLQLALTAIRYGAQNSVAIGGTADITGLEAAGGSIENDPQRSLAGPKPRSAAPP
jgi:hypothetical protein